jgi:hypothetical protein
VKRTFLTRRVSRLRVRHVLSTFIDLLLAHLAWYSRLPPLPQTSPCPQISPYAWALSVEACAVVFVNCPVPQVLQLFTEAKQQLPTLSCHFWPDLLAYGKVALEKADWWWLMPYRGLSLHDFLKLASSQTIAAEVWWSIGLQLAMALHLLHLRFATRHGDEHPWNVVIMEEEPVTLHLVSPIVEIRHTARTRVSLIDFGVPAARKLTNGNASIVTGHAAEEFANAAVWSGEFCSFLEGTPFWADFVGRGKKLRQRAELPPRVIFQRIRNIFVSAGRTDVTLRAAMPAEALFRPEQLFTFSATPTPSPKPHDASPNPSHSNPNPNPWNPNPSGQVG